MGGFIQKYNRLASFKIVLVYAAVSGIYIYTSDFFLNKIVHNPEVLSKIQTYKGLAFILITAVLLFFLIKKHLQTTASYYQELNTVRDLSNIQLTQSRTEYMYLFNHSPLPKWLFDSKTLQFILVNQAACSIYGYSEKEYKTMVLESMLPESDIEAMYQILQVKNPTTAIEIPDIIRLQKKNGEIVLVKVKANQIVFENRKVWAASAVDVTTEIEYQTKLEESNRRLQLASEIANIGYWENDLVANKIHWSPNLFNIFELDPTTPLSLELIRNLFHPEDQIYFDTERFLHLENRTINESERRIITPEGKIKWLLERQYLIRDDQGNPLRMEGIAMDITRRKIHEQEINDSNERFLILAKATVEAIIDWDLIHDTIFYGEGFQTQLGYDLSEKNPDLWSSNIHPEDREWVLKELNLTIKDPKQTGFNAEFRFLKADKTVAYMQLRGIFIRNEKGRVTRAIGAMIDLTETLERLREIEIQNKTLREIAWTQSHLVRAPLANIIGLVNLLQEKHPHIPPDTLIKYLAVSARELDNIVRDIVNKTAEIKK